MVSEQNVDGMEVVLLQHIKVDHFNFFLSSSKWINSNSFLKKTEFVLKGEIFSE